MSKLFVKPAASGKYHHSYQPSTIASLDFGQLLPVQVIESVPTDEWRKFSARGLIRLAPQVFPPYGKCYVKSAAFFVPEHQIIEQSEAFHTDMAQFKGKGVVMPFIRARNINQMFFLSGNGLSTVVATLTDPSTYSGSDDSFDFVYVGFGSTTYYFCKLTSLGSYYYKILKSLGYDFVSFPYWSGITAQDISSGTDYIVDLLPFLAFLKVYCDYFLNGPFYDYSPLVTFLHSVRNCEDFILSGTTFYTSSSGLVTGDAILYCLKNLFVPHEYNMYNEAWNYPNSPFNSNLNMNMEPGRSGDSSIMQPFQFGSEAETTYNTGNTLQINTQSSPSNISAGGLRLLQAFDRFVRRWHLSGSKAVQRVYAQFGIKSDDFNSHYVHKLFEGADQVKFNPVMSNTDSVSGSNGKPLGAYAGMGASGLNIDFNYKSSDYGFIIVVSWLQIVPMLLRGFNPSVLRIKPFDWFTPEFDGKASRAIPLCEVAVNKRSNSTVNRTDTAVYGFTDIYSEYRQHRDIIVGDFVNGLAKNFLFSRDLSVIRDQGLALQPQSGIVHYYDQVGNADMSDPFQMSQSNGDRFYLQFEWDIEAERPIKSSSDALDLNGVGDLQIDKNGNMIS